MLQSLSVLSQPSIHVTIGISYDSRENEVTIGTMKAKHA